MIAVLGAAMGAVSADSGSFHTVAVIGAGPNGCRILIALKERGISVEESQKRLEQLTGVTRPTTRY